MFHASHFKLFLYISIILGTALISVLALEQVRAETIQTSVQVIGVCGDGIKDANEDCDIGVGGQTCQGLGFGGGSLSCAADCAFDTSQCAPAGAVVPSGTGGGGYILPSAIVTLLGRAYPEATLTILKDGEIFIAGKKVDYSGDFAVRIFDIREGIYTFGFRAKDAEGRESITFNVTVTVSPATSITIGGIFIPPTIGLEKTILKKGETLKVSGQAGPQSEINISVIDSAGREILGKSRAKTNGAWLFTFDTSDLEEGFYMIKARAVSLDGLVSSYSQTLNFNIKGMLPHEEIPEEIPPEEIPEEIIKVAVDINRDGRVDLIDFSILLYWWDKYYFWADFNEDKLVDLVDFSIMMYWWTG